MQARREKDLFFCALLCVAVTAAFFPSLANGFTNFDDNAYLTENPLVRSLAPANIGRIFTTTRPHTVFSPLVTLSFALEYRMWGLQPRGYHAVNLLLHLLNALLVFFLIRGISSSPATAFFAALLFAIHPLRVESVAWITERKDLLSTLFLLLGLRFYDRYLAGRVGGNYLATLLLFALAILAKMSALVMPAILLLMDWKREGRIAGKRWLEKIPFALILLLFGFMGWRSLQAFSIEQTGPQDAGRQAVIVSNTLQVVPFYLQKTAWPARLSAHYPTDMRFFMPPAGLSLLLALALIAGSFLLLRRSWRDGLWGWGFFLVALLPTFGIVGNFFPVANRYSYLPAVGLSYVVVLAASQVGEMLGGRKTAKSALLALAVILLALLGRTAHSRCFAWKDSLSLWNDVIGNYPMIPLAYNSRALALKAAGRLDEAVADYSRAIRLMPHASFFWNRALALTRLGRDPEATADFAAAALHEPRYFRLYAQMTLDTQGRQGSERILALGRRVLAARPDARVHMDMAELLVRLRRWKEAEFHLQEAARLSPGKEEYREALRKFRRALGQHPEGK